MMPTAGIKQTCKMCLLIQPALKLLRKILIKMLHLNVGQSLLEILV